MSNIYHKISRGVLFTGFESLVNRIITFIVAIILARLLEPEVFGIIALMLTFIELSNAIIDTGFQLALIQKKEADALDYDSVFWGNLIVSCSLYFVILVFAPTITHFLNIDIYRNHLRILALSIPIKAIGMVHSAYLYKLLKFNITFKVGILSNLVAGIVGCYLAYLDCGIWALIIQQIVLASITSILLCLKCKWHPRLHFSFERLLHLFNFGWKLTVSSILNVAYHEAYTLIIGKLYSREQLSYYKRGNTFPHLIVSVLSRAVSGVLFPAFASIQDNLFEVRNVAKRSMQSVMFLLIPLLGTLIIVANPMIDLLLTSKWIPCVVFVQLSCLVLIFQPMNDINRQIMLALGHSAKLLKLEILLKVQMLIIIIVTYRYGVIAMVWGLVVQSLLVFIETAWPNSRLIHYNFIKQIFDICPFILSAVFSCTTSFVIIQKIDSSLIRLALGGFLSICLYILPILILNLIPDSIVNFYKTTTQHLIKTRP